MWGTADECRPEEECDNIVWGTSARDCDAGEECDNIVWGTSVLCESEECDNIVWGTSGRRRRRRRGATARGRVACDRANIVWGTLAARTPAVADSCRGDECCNIVWGTAPSLITATPATPPPATRKKKRSLGR